MKIKPINGYTKKDIIWYLTTFNDGTQCMDQDGVCAYESSNGNHCAVGCFIPSNHKGMELDGEVKILLEEYPDLEDYMPLEIAALVELQAIHDYRHGLNDTQVLKKYKDIKNVRERMLAWVEDNIEG